MHVSIHQGQEDVLGLQVAVDDALAVQVLHGLGCRHYITLWHVCYHIT